MTDEDYVLSGNLKFRWNEIDSEVISGLYTMPDEEVAFIMSDKGLTIKVPNDFFDEQEELNHKEMTLSLNEIKHIVFLLSFNSSVDELDDIEEIFEEFNYNLKEVGDIDEEVSKN